MSSDRPDDQPDDQPTPGRRSRRDGRPAGSFEFRERFGDGGDRSDAEGLREPAERGYTRPRGRLTVRQLMEQMGVEDAASNTSPGGPPARPQHRPTTPRPSVPQPPTRRARHDAPPPPAPTPPSSADETTALPPVAGFEWEPVDLSDETTAARVTDESRRQRPAPRRTPPTPPRPAAPAADDAPTAPPADEPASPGEPASSAETAERARPLPLQPTPDLADALEKARPTESARRRPRNKLAATGRILVALACVASLVGTGFVWNLNRTLNNALNVVNALDPNSKDVRDRDAQWGDETYLIVGTDTRSGENADVGAGEADTVEGARADTILLVNVPADRSRVVAVSWPRDLAVDRPECQNWDFHTQEYSGYLPAETDVKINGVFADGGPQCLVKVLTQMSGLDINHFIAMDFAGFEHVVRAIGGVQVCSEVPLFDDQIGYIVKTTG